jgi:Fe-S-cluster containining protein
MKNPYTHYPQMRPGEIFCFSCKCCGDCCRHVEKSVMVESLDLYRLARHFQIDMAEAAERYTETATVDWGAPVLMLKTVQPDDACIFLRNNKCSIESVKTRACRLYPLSAGPDDTLKNFLIFNVSDQHHHFNGPARTARQWVAENFRLADRTYILTEYATLQACGRIMRRIPRNRENQVLELMLLHRFVFYNTEQPFQPQFERNMKQLKKELERLATK